MEIAMPAELIMRSHNGHVHVKDIRGYDVLPANILTVSRIVLALALIVLPGLSLSFAVLYVLAGVTDVLDGWVARKTETASEAGAKLDNLADMVFVIVCLLTDHTGFYERYGWEFLCMVQGDGEPQLSRMYIHR